MIIPFSFWKISGTTDTNSSNQQAFLVMGDSIAKGTNSGTRGAGTAPTSGTSYYYVRSTNAIEEIGADDLILADLENRPNDGSPWPQFAINYNASTGKKAVIIPTGVGSSSFAYQADGSLCWDPNEADNLYDIAKADAIAAMSLLGVTKLKGIIINLGINDARQTVDLADFEAAADRLIAQIQTDFPDTDILLAQAGRSETATLDANIGRVRKKLRSICENNANCYLIGTPLAMPSASLIGTDNIHPTQPGNNEFGKCYARWFANSEYSKWARSIIASQFDDLSTARKGLIETFITGNLSDYLNHECLINLKTTVKNNTFVDWAFLNCPVDVNSSFTANSHIASDGTISVFYRSGYIPSMLNHVSAIDDIFIAEKIKANNSSVGSSGTAIGAADATAALNISQSATAITYRVSDLTTTQYTDETRFAADSEYLAARSGGTKYLYKNGVQVQSAAVAAVAFTTRQQANGANNSNGTFNSAIALQMQWIRGGKFSGVNHASFYAALNTLQSNW